MATPRDSREFDIIVYGATGYTGRLVAEYLVQHYGSRADAPKWAMAGRSIDKLAEVRDLIGAPADTPLVVANADDAADLAAMWKRTRVVLPTVGPYQLYGDKLLAACVATARPGAARSAVSTPASRGAAKGSSISTASASSPSECRSISATLRMVA